MEHKVLIVGGSLAALRTAEFLRSSGHEGPITVCGDEAHMPYNRPPLSKEAMLREQTSAALAETLEFRRRPSLADVRWLCGVAAVTADLRGHAVGLADGRSLSYDTLVAATGLRPRRLNIRGGESRRFVLRSVEDACRLRAAMVRGARMVVVGGGFIGCELASTASRLGLEVTVVESTALPMLRAIGPTLALALQDVHERAGVMFRLGVSVERIEEPGTVLLNDGSRLDADVIVESVGSRCNVEWLAGNNLDLSDGLACDDRMRVEGREDFHAVGDVAKFPDAFADGERRRVEHWCVPGLTAKRAAESIVATVRGTALAERFTAVPSFWSDQHGLRLQGFGMPALGDTSELLEGSLDATSMRQTGVAMGYYRHARLVGVVCVNVAPARLASFKARVADSAAESVATTSVPRIQP